MATPLGVSACPPGNAWRSSRDAVAKKAATLACPSRKTLMPNRRSRVMLADVAPSFATLSSTSNGLSDTDETALAVVK